MMQWWVIGQSFSGEWLIVDTVTYKPPEREAFQTQQEAQQECDNRNSQRH